MSNPNYGALASTTTANYRDKLEDNISTHVALYWWLKEAGQIEKKAGGEKIVVPLLYGENTTSSSYSGYDPLSLTPQTGISAAEYTWRNHAVGIAMSGEEKRKNSGPEAFIDLWASKVKQAELSAIEDFDDMFSIATAAGNSGKDFDGINVLIGDHSSAVTTVGGINCATAGNEYWRSYVERTVKAITLADIHTAFYNASRGPSKPKVGFTTLTLYAAIEAQIQPAQRYTDAKMAAVGFDNISIKGARVTHSASFPTGFFTWVNSDFVKLVQHKDAWLTPTEVDKPSGIDAMYQHLISMGNLVTSNRKLAGSRLEGRTA